jgi:Domain of unknown function (DUF1993)
MAFTLYDATVANYLQTIGGVSAILDRGLDYCQEKGLNPEEFVESRMAPDMRPLRFQVNSVAHHSLGAIEGAKTEIFSPSKATTYLITQDFKPCSTGESIRDILDKGAGTGTLLPGRRHNKHG